MEKKKPPYLPSELVIQILVRLPVKSLIRFKCVSKSWLTLISDPNFANSHFQLTAPHTRRILAISSLSHEIQSIDFESSVNHEYTSLTLNLNSPPPFSFPLEIEGSCRGFLFLRHYSKFYLWNPSTGFHRQIPESPFHSKFDVRTGCFPCVYGFGYDQSRDDYLLVLLSSKTKHDLWSYLEFFSLRDNTWKEIKGTHFPYNNANYDPGPGTLFNGAIHWLGNVIVVFDLMERKLSGMNLPDDLEHAPGYLENFLV
ncbi:F-box/kelch-repeat protein [Trifolium pratense]|uniref:F-box/kelch-repeat protein n=1 Tax=Trifolium pratense TaxID=57577 RepID=A0A2K3LZJ2_TRIPR|nr:F-box/kelch-repeat protein [Trifolium pratense]